jgi:hypothetical protein
MVRAPTWSGIVSICGFAETVDIADGSQRGSCQVSAYHHAEL